MKKLFIFFLVTTIFLVSIKNVHASQVYDMSDNSNWNLRIDGPQENSFFGLTYKNYYHDINNNGAKDLIVCAAFEESPNKPYSGACYLIYDTILSNFSEKGSVLDLNDSNNYNLRFEGPVAGSKLGYTTGAFATDLNGNGKTDLLLPASGTHIARPGAGAFYVIFDDIIGRYTGTGNMADLSLDSNFSIRYDGSSSVSNKNYISESFLVGHDMDGNGVDDIVVGSGHTGLEGRARSGSLYIIHDELFNQFEGTGNVVDLEQPENYNLVYYNAAGSYFSLFGDIELKDLDGNNKPDILVGAGYADNNSRTNSGSVYLINDSLINNYSGTGNRVDLTDLNNFNIRVDGASSSDFLSYNGLTVGNIDDNLRKDILITSHSTDYNSRTNSGSVYILFDSLLNKYSGTGNTIDLANTGNFNLRFDGAFANSTLGYGVPTMSDLDGNGRTDIILTAPGDSHNLRVRSGSTYIIYDSLLLGYSNTGNLVDLANTSNYNIRYDGRGAGDYFGFSSDNDDYNEDGISDIFITAINTDYHGRNNAGSIYIIFSFPHTITTNSSIGKGQTKALTTGKIIAPNSTTNIAGAQWSFSNDPLGDWHNCEPIDGAFDSQKESFKCNITNIDKNENVFFKAHDENGIFTPKSNYSKLQISH